MAKTDAPQRPERAEGGTNWIPVGVAVLTVGLFLVWLATRRPPETVAVEEPGADAPEQVDVGGPATQIEPDRLVATAEARSLIGQDVQLASVPVSDVLGSQMFWIELPGGAPYLVKLDSAQVARGVAVPTPGGRVQVVGRVSDKTTAVVDGWMERGVLQTEDQRMLAEFGSTYIEARRVTPAGG